MDVVEKRRKLDEFCDKYNYGNKCPLNYPACRCGCATHFLRKREDGTYEMSDEEINAAYYLVIESADSVNHPSHYADGKIEVIDFIEDKKLGFCLGNAVKYISRAGKKDPTKEVEDLRKAVWYIERHIWGIENETS